MILNAKKQHKNELQTTITHIQTTTTKTATIIITKQQQK